MTSSGSVEGMYKSFLQADVESNHRLLRKSLLLMPNLKTISLFDNVRYVSISVPRDPRSDVRDFVLTHIDDHSKSSTYLRKHFTVLCQDIMLVYEDSLIVESVKF